MKNLLVGVLVTLIQFGYSKDNNVCKTVDDYYTDRNLNPNCYYNPDVYLSVPEIIRRHGYTLETYTVTTADGYILTIFRIPYAKVSSIQQPGPPVFILHGLGVSSMTYVNLGKNSLADKGYDVWLGNFRGTQYSNRHVSLSNKDAKYWDFTFHELGVYDIRSQLDLVFNITKQKVLYIGYSAGSTCCYIYNSEFPELSKQRIRLVINLGGTAFFGSLTAAIRPLLPFWQLVEGLVSSVTRGRILERSKESLALRESACLPYPAQMTACLSILYFVFGFDSFQENPETLPVIVMQDTDAFSVKAMSHLIQLMMSNEFHMFDYKQKNLQIYGTLSPPRYNLSRIDVPNHFIIATNDAIVNKPNIEKTRRGLTEAAKPFEMYVIDYPYFTHFDFIAAKDIKELAYDHVVDFLNNVARSF